MLKTVFTHSMLSLKISLICQLFPSNIILYLNNNAFQRGGICLQMSSNFRSLSYIVVLTFKVFCILLPYPEFPRLGSLRGCERAHVLAVRTCKHFASEHPRDEKSARVKAVDKCYRDASALLRKPQ